MSFVHRSLSYTKSMCDHLYPFNFVTLQNILPIWDSVGQLHAQLSAPEQSHSIWGEDLHHPLCLFRGDRVTIGTLLIGLTRRSISTGYFPCTGVEGWGGHVCCVLTRWRTVPSQRSSPKISAWCFIPAMQSCPHRAPSGISSARVASDPLRGT